MRKRMEVVRLISEKMCIYPDHCGPLHLLPNIWLKSWVAGIWVDDGNPTGLAEDTGSTHPSLIDLTEAVEGSRLSRFFTSGILFDDPPVMDSFICRHKNGICPSRQKDLKVVSDFVYSTIVSTLTPDPPTILFTTATAYCKYCAAEYEDHSIYSAKILNSMQDIIKLVGQGTENEFESFVLSKTWLTQLRKLADSMQKEAGPTSKSVEAYFKDASKPVFERIDSKVNSNLCCAHLKLRKGFKRSSILVSRQAWVAIQSLCTNAIAFTGYEESCAECVVQESMEESRKEELQEERGAQLEDPALRELVRLLKRKPYYPIELDKPEFFGPGRYFLIESLWLRAWHSYILDISAPEPGSHMNFNCSVNLGRSTAEP